MKSKEALFEYDVPDATLPPKLEPALVNISEFIRIFVYFLGFFLCKYVHIVN